MDTVLPFAHCVKAAKRNITEMLSSWIEMNAQGFQYSFQPAAAGKMF